MKKYFGINNQAGTKDNGAMSLGKMIKISALSILSALVSIPALALENGSIVATDPNLFKVAQVFTLNESGGEQCTGVIVAKDLVLTAYHCVSRANIKGFVSFTDPLTQEVFDRPIVGTMRDARQKEVDPELARLGSIYTAARADVALVLFADGLPPKFKPAEFLPNFNSLKAEAKMSIYGAGMTSETGEWGDVLRIDAQLKVWLESVLVVKTAPHTNLCRGDSGGPIFIEIENKSYLCGIVSGTPDGGVCSHSEHAVGANLGFELTPNISGATWFEGASAAIRVP